MFDRSDNGFTEVDGDDDIQVGHNFTFIPPNPRRFYKRLLEMCLVADLELMLSPEVDDNDEVSLGILSHAHIELLNEVALRWRIGHPYRSAAFLDLVKQFYERGDVPLECIPEGLQNIDKVMHDLELELWPVQDVCACYTLVLFLTLVRSNILLAYVALFSLYSYHHCITRWRHSLV